MRLRAIKGNVVIYVCRRGLVRLCVRLRKCVPSSLCLPNARKPLHYFALTSDVPQLRLDVSQGQKQPTVQAGSWTGLRFFATSYEFDNFPCGLTSFEQSLSCAVFHEG